MGTQKGGGVVYKNHRGLMHRVILSNGASPARAGTDGQPSIPRSATAGPQKKNYTIGCLLNGRLRSKL